MHLLQHLDTQGQAVVGMLPRAGQPKARWGDDIGANGLASGEMVEDPPDDWKSWLGRKASSESFSWRARERAW